MLGSGPTQIPSWTESAATGQDHHSRAIVTALEMTDYYRFGVRHG
jgi:hypothetical protein